MSRTTFNTLPEEIRQIIYQHALCPPEGLTIKSDSRSSDPAESRFKSVPGVPAALLRTCRHVYDGAKSYLYRNKVLCLDMTCENALEFLQRLPQSARSQIRSLRLCRCMMAFYDIRNHIDVATRLAGFILEAMSLDTVTLAMPDDLTVGDFFGGDYDWWSWLLHRKSIEAFRDGHFTQLRLSHPRHYSEKADVHDFHNVRSVEKWLLGMEKWESIEERIQAYWGHHHRLVYVPAVFYNTRETLRELARKTLLENGFVIQRDEPEPGENGTVLVIRRVPLLEGEEGRGKKRDEPSSLPHGN